jgi:peptidoglycan/xylan/chitin deacetylase (PgdA/CDA1 family)
MNDKTESKKIAILGYHKVGDPPADGWYTWSYVPDDVFRKQLDYLKENNWQVISLELFMAALLNPDLLPAKTVLLTFDDGYRSNLRIVAPILQQYQHPAVIFVPTNFIGGYNAFDADIFYEPREVICNWQELAELNEIGIAVQSHGIQHRHFSRLTTAEIWAEINKSKDILENKLGKAVELFSFPYGDNGLDTEETDGLLKEAGYKAACLYGTGGKPMQIPLSSPYHLVRVPVGPDTDMKSALVD